MNYQERVEFIKSKIGSTEDKNNLKKFLDSIKTSDLKAEDKARFIDDINYKLTGRRYTDKEVMQDILDGMPEIDDIN